MIATLIQPPPMSVDFPIATRIENIRQPLLDLLILLHDQATAGDWIGLQRTAQDIAHEGNLAWLEEHANDAGIIQH